MANKQTRMKLSLTCFISYPWNCALLSHSYFGSKTGGGQKICQAIGRTEMEQLGELNTYGERQSFTVLPWAKVKFHVLIRLAYFPFCFSHRERERETKQQGRKRAGDCRGSHNLLTVVCAHGKTLGTHPQGYRCIIDVHGAYL